MKALPYTKEAYRLLHEGSIALAQVEANGVRVDVPYVHATIQSNEARVVKLQKRMEDSKVMRVWRKTFKDRTNTNSNEQLGKILFDVLGYDCPEKTDTGRHKTDEKTLATVDIPFVRKLLRIKKIQKGNQFLKGMAKEVCGKLLHPVFSLNTTITYRSSSDSPNFQNLPVRDAKQADMVRRAIIARKGRQLVEIDYKGVEIAIAACYHQDPRMVEYISDKSKDMHRDIAEKLYCLPRAEISDNIRHAAKNKFVFPEFYGSYWLECSGDLWGAIDPTSGYARRMVGEGTAKDPTGGLVRKVLAKHGIRELGNQDRKGKPKPGSFEEHVQKAEAWFWGPEQFHVYAQWKKDWFAAYQKQGWFLTKTGFICQGFMRKNEVINYPVQGSAFHCLLWSLTELVIRHLRKRKLRTLIVGQIHDSLLMDVPEEEVEEILALCYRVMVVLLKRAWGWINVPLEIDASVSPPGGSWVDKQKAKIPT